MIDFRYHLVSLISVFLALAVGIVLGAGPLRESLGSQLTGQVEQLRAERDQLRAQGDDLTAQQDELAAYIGATGPALVAGSLEGTRTAVVYDSGSVSAPVNGIGALLTAAGAEQVLTVRLERGLWDPAGAESRSGALTALRALSPQTVAEAEQSDGALAAAGEDSDAAVLGSVITVLVTSPDLAEETRTQMWSVLEDASLVSADGETALPADSVMVAGAAAGDLAVEGEDSALAAQRAQLLLETQSGLLLELAEAQVPAVVTAATPQNDDTVGLLRTVRGDARFAGLSTADRLQAPDGPAIAVLALAEQLRGGSGSYGTASDARARVPETPALAGEASDGGQG